jgi:hypothetical protein
MRQSKQVSGTKAYWAQAADDSVVAGTNREGSGQNGFEARCYGHSRMVVSSFQMMIWSVLHSENPVRGSIYSDCHYYRPEKANL